MHTHSTPDSGSLFIRQTLITTKNVSLVACEWPQGHTSELHHHDFSQCFVYIKAGEFENTVIAQGQEQKTIYRRGDIFVVPQGASHAFKCVSPQGRTLHLYSPPLEVAGKPLHFRVSEQDVLNDISVGESTDWNSLTQLVEKIRQHSVSTHSPLFMNQLFSGVRPEALMADAVIAQTRTTMATHEASPLFTNIEKELVRSLAQRLHWNTFDGVGVPGGSAANFMAIHCARHIYYPQIKKEGMGDKKFRIFVSDQSHYSFAKACVVLGLGSDALIKVKSDSEGRMIPSELVTAVHKERHLGHLPLMVGATAGTTVMGAFDPLKELSQICREESLWLHVDGAWGGPVLFNNEHRHLLEGIDLADSFAIEAHKLLGASLTSTLFLTRHKKILFEANDVTGADYLFHDNGCMDLGRLSWQCGRRADSFSFWVLWKSYGDEGFDAMISQLYQRRDEFIQRIKGSDRYRLIHSPSFLNVCFQFADTQNNDERILQLRESLIAKNMAFINYSQDPQNGRYMRMIFANPNLTTQHIDQLIDQLHL